MPTKLGKQIRNIVFVGLGVFVLVNGCSWQPGYGDRNDRKPGMEVERYFGWPACFYADLWQSDEATEVEPWNYAPPLPITSDMHYIYCSFGVVPLLLDIAIIVAAMGIAVVIKGTGKANRPGVRRRRPGGEGHGGKRRRR